MQGSPVAPPNLPEGGRTLFLQTPVSVFQQVCDFRVHVTFCFCLSEVRACTGARYCPVSSQNVGLIHPFAHRVTWGAHSAALSRATWSIFLSSTSCGQKVWTSWARNWCERVKAWRRCARARAHSVRTVRQGRKKKVQGAKRARCTREPSMFGRTRRWCARWR